MKIRGVYRRGPDEQILTAQREEYRAARDRFFRVTHWVLIALATMIVSNCFVALLRRPETRLAALVPIAIGWLLLRHRDCLTLRRKSQPFSIWQFLAVPHVLLIASLVSLGLGVFFQSWSAIVATAALYLCWTLARVIRIDQWHQISGTFLLLACLPIGMSSLDHEAVIWQDAIQQHLSGRLDQMRVAHWLNQQQLVLIDSGSEIGLRRSSTLGFYSLFVMQSIVSVWRGHSAIRLSLQLLAVAIIGMLISPLRLVAGGCLEACGVFSNLPYWLSPTVSTEIVAFLAAIVLLGVWSAVLTFVFSPIEFGSSMRSNARLYCRRFNQMVTLRWAHLFAGDRPSLTKQRWQSVPYALAGAWQFVGRYTATRRYLMLLTSFLMLGGLVWGGHMIGLLHPVIRTQSVIHDFYEQKFDQQLRDQSLERADWILNRFKAAHVNVEPHLLRVADALLVGGKREQAIERVETLHRESPGTATATWLIKQLLLESEGRIEQLEPDQRQRLARYCSQILERDPNHFDMTKLFVMLKLDQARRLEALRQLSESQPARLGQQLELAAIELALGGKRQSSERLDRVIRQVERIPVGQRDEATWCCLIKSQLMSSQFIDAARSADQALSEFAKLAKTGDLTQLKRLALSSHAGVCDPPSDNKPAKRRAPSAQMLHSFTRLIELDEQDHRLQHLCAKWLVSFSEQLPPRTREQCKEVIQRSIASAEPSPEMLIVLGTSAAMRKDYSQAETLLRRAIEQGDRSPQTFNNLAWVMTQRSQPDWRAALRYAEQAIQTRSLYADAILTRSDCLMHLGSHFEAIADLEKLYERRQRVAEVVPRLAVCYAATGEAELAAALLDQHGQ